MIRAMATAAAMAVLPSVVGAAWPYPGLRWPVRWLIGYLAIGLLAWLCVAAQVPPLAAVAAELILVTVGGLAAWRSRGVAPPSLAPAERWLHASLALLLVVAVAITLAQPVTGFDAVAIWLPKAQAFSRWIPPSGWPVSSYPGLGAVLWGLPLSATGPGYEELGRTVFIGAYMAFAWSLAELCDRPMRAISAVLVGVVAVAALDHAATTSGYQDTLVMSLAGVAAVMFARDLMNGAAGCAPLALALTGLLGLVKLEGAVLGGLMTGVWLAIRMWDRVTSRHLPEAAYRWLAVYLLLASAWPLYTTAKAIGISPDWVPEQLSLGLLVNRLDRLPVILDRLLMLRPSHWLPVAAAACLTAGAWPSRPLRLAICWAWLVALLHLAAIIGMFTFTNAPLDWHLTTALSRLVSQQAGLSAAIIVLAGADLARSGMGLMPRRDNVNVVAS